MKRIVTVLSLLVLGLSAVMVSAQCPDDVGVFTTLDGTLESGRMTEAWCDGIQWDPGNALNCESWDGAVLGGQWKIYGLVVDAAGATLVGSNLDSWGNGTEDYSVNYTGGEFWLSADNTWGDGTTDLYGVVEGYHLTATITYVMSNPVAMTTNSTWTGAFIDCDPSFDCGVNFALANSTLLWTSDSGEPALDDFPALLCGAGDGEMHDMPCLTFSLDCTVGTERTTWSSMKSTFR